MPIGGPKRVSGRLHNNPVKPLSKPLARPKSPFSQMPYDLKVRILKLATPFLDSENLLVRIGAAEVVGRLGKVNKAMNVLEPLLSNTYLVIRDAIKAIGKFGYPEETEKLKPFLSHPEAMVVSAAAEAIGRLGDTKTALDALKAIVPEDFPIDITCTIDAIGEIGDPRGLDLIIPSITNHSPAIAASAIKAIGKIGSSKEVELLLKTATSLIMGEEPFFVELNKLEAIVKLGDKGYPSWAFTQLISRAASESENIAPLALEIIGRLGLRALGGSAGQVKKILENCMSHANPGIKIAAAEAYGKLFDADKGIKALISGLGLTTTTTLRGSLPFEVNTKLRAQAIGRIGAPQGVVKLLGSVPLYPHILVATLKEFLDNYNPALDPEPEQKAEPHPTVKLANFIRAVCKKLDRVKEDKTVQGFQNKGIHQGRRPESAGFDFREYRKVEVGQPVYGRIDPNVLMKTGKVYERVYQQTQAVNTMIVISPLVMPDYESVQLLAGTIAQRAIRRKDPVGLVIGTGKGGGYLPPGKKAALEHILSRATLSDLTKELYQEKGQKPTSCIPLLKQNLLTRHLPVGSAVYLIANFFNEQDMEGLQKVVSKLRAKGIQVVPVQIGSKILLPAQSVKIGRHSYRVRGKSIVFLEQMKLVEKAKAVNTFIRTNNGIAVKTDENKGRDFVPQQVFQELSRPANKRRLASAPEVETGGNEDIIIPEAVPPDNILDLLEDALETNDLKKLAMLVFTAKVRGWTIVLDWVEAKRLGERLAPRAVVAKRHADGLIDWSMLFSLPSFFAKDLLERIYMEGDLSPVEKIEHIRLGCAEVAKAKEAKNEVEELHYQALLATFKDETWKKVNGELIGPWNVALWGPTDGDLAVLMQKYESEKQQQKTTTDDGKKTAPAQRRKPISISQAQQSSPINSGVDKDTTDEQEQVWLELEAALQGAHRYLALGFFGDHNPRTATYQEVAGLPMEAFQVGEGRMINGKIAKGTKVDRMPTPLGGKVVTHKKALIGRDSVVFELSTSKPAEGLLDLSVAEFRQRVQQIYGNNYETLTQTAPLDSMPADIQQLIKSLENVSAQDAISAIRSFVIENFQYRGYAGEVEKTLFADLKKRAQAGELKRANEYLKLVLDLRAGKCSELSEVTLALLRLAGIPAAKCTCYVAENNKVDGIRHEVAVAIFPGEKGNWHAEPVEASVGYVLQQEREETATVFEGVQLGIRDQEVKEQVLPADLDYWKNIWQNASAAQKREISNAWQYFYFVLQNKGLKFGNTPVGLLLSDPEQYSKYKSNYIETQPPWHWFKLLQEQGLPPEDLTALMGIRMDNLQLPTP